jgi:hypothetical protein
MLTILLCFCMNKEYCDVDKTDSPMEFSKFFERRMVNMYVTNFLDHYDNTSVLVRSF